MAKFICILGIPTFFLHGTAAFDVTEQGHSDLNRALNPTSILPYRLTIYVGEGKGHIPF